MALGNPNAKRKKHRSDDKLYRYDGNTPYSSVTVLDSGREVFVTDGFFCVVQDLEKALTSSPAIVDWLDRFLPTP